MTESTAPSRDSQLRFILESAGVRGVHVHLDDTWSQIRVRESYAPAAEELLGQACAAAALFTGHTKVNGRLSVQMRSDGAIRTLFAECTAAGTLRGIVQMSEESTSEVSRDLRDLGAGAILAITVENHGRDGDDPTRYQGLVPLEASQLDLAFEDYFRQSEQLPTRLLLASDGSASAGLMLQKLPGDEGDVDGWNRAGALFDTLTPAELLALPGDEVLHRLFHEEDVRHLGTRSLSFGCSCSQARVESMLVALGREEAQLAAVDGEARIRCEFCGQGYTFSPAQIEQLFVASDREVSGPGRPQ